MNILEKIKKIESYKTWSIKRKVDALKKMDTFLYTNLGSESTKKETSEVKKISKIIYKAISSISPVDGFLLKSQYIEFPVAK
tara:strand:+ start:6981 stop:7226 length:246 start_codon:yes stop_codon:yes gene_type:complete